MCSALRSSASRPSKIASETLKTLLEKLHLSLGAPLHPADSSAWKAAARAFAEDTRTVQRYATHGWKHLKLFKTGGLDLQEALDARSGLGCLLRFRITTSESLFGKQKPPKTCRKEPKRAER